MHKFLVIFALLSATSSYAADVDLDSEPARGTALSVCKDRNRMLNDQTMKTGVNPTGGPAVDEDCNREIQIATLACSKDPEVSNDDITSAKQAGAASADDMNGESSTGQSSIKNPDMSAISSQRYVNAAIYNMKGQKLKDRAAACRELAKKVQEVCNKRLDTMKQQISNSGGDGSGEDSAAAYFGGPRTATGDAQVSATMTKTATDEAVKTLKTGAYCDLISTNDQAEKADAETLYAQSVSTHPDWKAPDPKDPSTQPLVPPDPDPKNFGNAPEKEKEADTNLEKLTGSTALGTGTDKVLNLVPGDSKEAALAKAVGNAANGNFVEAGKSTAEYFVQAGGWSYLKSAAGYVGSAAYSVAEPYVGSYVSSAASYASTATSYLPSVSGETMSTITTMGGVVSTETASALAGGLAGGIPLVITSGGPASAATLQDSGFVKLTAPVQPSFNVSWAESTNAISLMNPVTN